MRRKSERNKVKGTPEKKTEKPTRKSLRRRGKTSPSTSPERDNMDDNVSSTPYSDDEGETQVLEKIQEEEADKEVSSSGLIKSVLGEENDNGSVWKVARADASPGEIQKLKLCRQRSNLETPDNFLGKKKSNKWPDSGDGSIDEGDLVVEQSMSPMETFINLNANDPSSSRLSQVPDEEVSDFKKTLTETTSANLSDVKTNVDQQPDYKGELPELSSENSQQENRDLSQEQQFFEEDPLKDIQPQEDTNDSQPYNSNYGGMVNQEVIDGNFTEVTTSEISTVDVQQSNVSQMEISEPDLCKKNEIRDDNVQLDSNLNNDLNDKNIFNNNADKIEMSDFVNQGNINSISNSEESNTKTNNESTEMESNNKDTNNIKEFVEAGQKDTGGVSSQENTENYLVSEKESNLKDTSHSTKRKHYNKYDDSSNSESQDSDEESGEIREDKSSPEPQDKLKEEEKLKTQNSQSNIEYDIEMSENTKDDVLEINEKIDDMNSSMTVSVSKPAKVCLKRSFSARVSTDSENKKEDMYKIDDNELSQNKENCAANDQPDSKNAPKKRRWGITSTPADVLPAFSISTDSLKELVPGAKPLSASEVRLSKDDDEHKDHKYKNDVDSQLKKKENQTHRQRDSKLDNHVARKITVGNDVQRHRSPSPQDAQPTNILLIKNLVRPFTLNQIKELLSRTGTIVENGFWMDRIKSKCFVEYTNEDQAFETRQALHGTSWPLSNPKKLQVEYSTKEAMNSARDVSKEQTFTRKAEQNAVSDTWQNDWAREERPSVNNKISVIREWDLGKEDGHLSLKERERERKEFEKRRRQRSPIIEVHLPAPARKFKKKEEEPPTAKLLDDLFRKTKATPCIYWLPLTNEQIIVKEEMRRQHMAEHARRLEEMRRLERNRDSRRRRSPRK